MTKLLIFDFDGVIVDSLAFYFEAWSRAMKAFGREDLAEREAFLSLLDGNLYESMSRQGIPFRAFPELSNRIQSALRINRIVPFPGIPEAIQSLSRNKSLALVSSNNSSMIKSLLERHGMSDIFDPILGADTERLKGHKIDLALEAHNVPAVDSFYICDTVGDIREARSVDICVAAVTWGWHNAERLARAKPDRILHCPQELMEL
ncbi:MAG: HAD family hydrolase [Deltaproteobacteria bacterium]|nr:HAD family hydrolase [Deltaproteobacteria bacterium]MBW2306344.1 HAD family hydrolase [Deltaproteobacteria bacterium]